MDIERRRPRLFLSHARGRLQGRALPHRRRPLRFRCRPHADQLVLPPATLRVAVGCARTCHQRPSCRRHPQRELSKDEFGGKGGGVLPQCEPSTGPRVSRALHPASLPTRPRAMKHTLSLIALAVFSLSVSAASTDPL